jgi:uncharacterized repeat protein (TIGR01451 family)
VPSGPFTLTDWVPDGLTVVDTGGGVESGGIVTWTITDSLEPGKSTSVSLRVEITDFNQRPFRNVAEISADSADLDDTAGPVPLDVSDIDSVADADPLNDVQTADQSVFQPGVGGDNDPAVDSDDHDNALFAAGVEYDLALVQILPFGQDYEAGSPIEFRIEVKNQRTVNSLEFTIADVIPTGMSFRSASAGGTHSNGVVTWTIHDLAPGAPPGW